MPKQSKQRLTRVRLPVPQGWSHTPHGLHSPQPADRGALTTFSSAGRRVTGPEIELLIYVDIQGVPGLARIELNRAHWLKSWITLKIQRFIWMKLIKHTAIPTNKPCCSGQVPLSE